MFSANEGTLDRALRVVVGVVLLWLGIASGIVTGALGIVAIVVGALAFFTGITGFCALYRVLGINTGSPEA